MKRLVVGLLSHVDSGKTTLAEGLLYRAGALRKLAYRRYSEGRAAHWLLLLYAGWQVLQRKDIGMMLGIGFAGLNAFTQLMFIGAYPAWSISIMVLDLIVIYALSAHSGEFE